MHENQFENDSIQQYTKPKISYKEFHFSNQNFNGIINYLRKNNNVKDEINITYSSDIYIILILMDFLIMRKNQNIFLLLTIEIVESVLNS